MFCHQCEQAAKGIGCEVLGVCGKKPDVAALQDNLLYGLKGLSMYANEARKLGAKDQAIDVFMLEGLFATVTNVDFDPARLEATIKKCFEMKEKAKALYEKAAGIGADTGLFAKLKAFFVGDEKGSVEIAGPAAWVPAADLVKQGEQYGVLAFHSDPDIRSAIEILIYGLKGMAAYADHCQILGKHNDEVYAFFHQALAATCRSDPRTDGLRRSLHGVRQAQPDGHGTPERRPRGAVRPPGTDQGAAGHQGRQGDPGLRP